MDGCDQSTPLGRRDYAVLLLLARLGLRGGEVVGLSLDDINWEAGEVLVRGKSAPEVLANRHLLAFFKKISGGSFGGFGQRLRLCHFGSFVSCCYQAFYECSEFGAVKRPTRNYFD